MIKRMLFACAAVGLIGFALPARTAAQTIYVSGGATFPTGDYGDYAKTGWMGAAGMLFPVGGMGLALGAEGFYGQNNHSDVDGDKTSLYGGLGIVEYEFSAGGSVIPYVFGGLGLMVHKYSSDEFPEFEDSDSKFAYQFGGGVGFGLSENVLLYGEGRYMGREGTQFFGLFGGLAFGLGN